MTRNVIKFCMFISAIKLYTTKTVAIGTYNPQLKKQTWNKREGVALFVKLYDKIFATPM